MKRKTLESELIQKKCVLEERKAKRKALAKEDFLEANWHAIRENICIIQREKAKN
jgi:hypothetical protein